MVKDGGEMGKEHWKGNQGREVIEGGKAYTTGTRPERKTPTRNTLHSRMNCALSCCSADEDKMEVLLLSRRGKVPIKSGDLGYFQMQVFSLEVGIVRHRLLLMNLYNSHVSSCCAKRSFHGTLARYFSWSKGDSLHSVSIKDSK